MAATSLSEARTDLYTLLVSDLATGAPHADLTAVTKVYKYEPLPGDILKPISITILTSGMDPEFYEFEIRIYASDGANTQTQANLDSAIQQVDTRLRGSAEFGPSNWSIEWVDELGCWIARANTTAGRQDYF
jgi:hypothetical protein